MGHLHRIARATAVTESEPGRPWRLAIAWLLLLGPFFFLTYNFANSLAAQQPHVPAIVFAWESAIPFWGWTIVPYWSIDLFYAASLFVCTSRRELNTHGLRLVTAQLLAVATFIAFPLRFSFDRPIGGDWSGELFRLLAIFDKPFNQAPSLHIALLVILWVLYARHTRGWWRWALHGWFALIGISVLTTYQHHFFDVPTGLLLGWLCIWLWPDNGRSPLSQLRLSDDKRRRAIALRYGLASAALAIVAVWFKGAALWLLWPALSLGLVAAAYLALDVAAFQKTADGRHTFAARWLFAPYTWAARLNARLWTGRQAPCCEIAPNVWLGRLPRRSEVFEQGFAAVVDLSAELTLPLDRWSRLSIFSHPVLDLTAPRPALLASAAASIEQARQQGPVLVCCALGYSRSALATAAWLLRYGHASDPTQALAIIRARRPQIVVGAEQAAQLAACLRIAPSPA